MLLYLIEYNAIANAELVEMRKHGWYLTVMNTTWHYKQGEWPTRRPQPCILTRATTSYCTRPRRRGWKYLLEKSL